jgi:nucleotide-binding universal stress UspA family protein
MTAPVVAGVDGSDESLAAVQWGAVAAARRGVPLCIMHVIEHHAEPSVHAQILSHDPYHWARAHGLSHGAKSALARASHRAVHAAPGIDLRVAAVFGRADQVLTAITSRAPLLAIGARGTGRASGQRVGSVALSLASSARCPVVFTSASSRPDVREIVVGADESSAATAALEFSFAEADVRGARLTAVYAWAHPETGRLDGYHDWMLSAEPVDESAAFLLSEQVSPWRHEYPNVTVTEDSVRGHPGRALTLASRSSDLIVIGSRRDQASANGPGPVAHAMLQHAQCPVAIIPGTALPCAGAVHVMDVIGPLGGRGLGRSSS